MAQVDFLVTYGQFEMPLQFKRLFQCQKLYVIIYGLRYRSFPIQLVGYYKSILVDKPTQILPKFESGLHLALKK